MKIYTSHNCSATYRARIALHIKGLPYESEYVELDEQTGESSNEEFLAMNPDGTTPVIVEGRRIFRQGVAFMEYLEESYPSPSIIPGSNRDRERIRALATVIGSDIDALIDPRATAYLAHRLNVSSEECTAWRRHWIHRGLQTLERLMEDNPGTARFCHGDVPTMADICLVSQVPELRRLGGSLDRYPTIARVVENCMELEEFRVPAPKS
jgi:maleylacetoacetate isomerase